MITIGIASDKFRHDDRSLAYYPGHWIGYTLLRWRSVEGEDFFEGLGFSPAISLNFDGIATREEAASYGLKVSQIDCHYALHRWQSIPSMPTPSAPSSKCCRPGTGPMS